MITDLNDTKIYYLRNYFENDFGFNYHLICPLKSAVKLIVNLLAEKYRRFLEEWSKSNLWW